MMKGIVVTFEPTATEEVAQQTIDAVAHLAGTGPIYKWDPRHTVIEVPQEDLRRQAISAMRAGE